MAFATAFNEQANEDAPPAVRAAVALDSQSLTGRVANAAFADVTRTIAERMGNAVSQRVKGTTGQVLQQSITAAAAPPSANQNGQSQTENPIAKGAKGIGRGIKRLFGGGKNDSKPANANRKPSPKNRGESEPFTRRSFGLRSEARCSRASPGGAAA